ncbi:MAG: 3-oxoacyl-[acyl-carrier protein] reductase [Limisphaerales bacterium]|jgi:3-oxoacyl-[acyl-carrier protein] reductase
MGSQYIFRRSRRGIGTVDFVAGNHFSPMLPPVVTIDLSGKNAIITGGGQGLGRATATTLHNAGARVAISYFRDDAGENENRAQETANDLGGQAIAIEGDVRERASVDRMFKAFEEQAGPVHIVVNNAAILRDRSIRKMEDSEWDAVIQTNLTGVYNVCKEAADRLADGGRIVNMASISGFVGFFGQANYSAAKAGVVGLTKALSKELARRQITVNAVAPGVVLTEMGKSIPESARVEMLKQIPLNRFGEPEEVANAILFLCSPLATYVTGQTIHVNGGWFG